MLIAYSAPAQNLFVANNNGTITQITPGGAQSTFASGFSFPTGLAFNSAGNLFVADNTFGSITKITPGGAQSTFVSGLNNPFALAFQPVPEPSVLGLLAIGAAALLIRRQTCQNN